MIKKSSMWWGGAFMALLAAQAGAQQNAVVKDADTGSGQQAVPVLSPLRVEGQLLETALPEGSTITTRQELDERSINSWEDFAKRGEPGVNFNAATKSINIRGMDQDRVVTRVDGIRIPWLNDGARGEKGGLDTIDFNSLSSIDLVRSAGSPQSGSLVGYLDLHTLSPDDLLAPGKDFGALLKGAYDSADESWSGDAALAGRIGQGDTSWLLQVGQRRGHELDNMGEVGGYGPNRELPNPEDYKQQNVMLKLQHLFNVEHKLTLSGEHFRRTSDIDNRREQDTSTYDIGNYHSGTETRRERVVLAYDFNSIESNAALNHGDVKFYWQRSSLDGTVDAFRNMDGRGMIPPLRPFGYSYPYGPYGRDNSVEESGFGVLTSWDGFLEQGTVQHHWALGAEWHGIRAKQRSSGYDNCPSNLRPVPLALSNMFGPRSCDMLHSNQADVADAEGRQWALWAQDEISWAGGRYALIPALRFDSYRYTPQTSGSYESNPNAAVTAPDDNSGSRVSPSLLARYAPQETLSFYARYGYGYKAPTATQLYMNYGAPGTYLRTGNPDLKAETSRGWELGMDVGDADLGGRLSVFENRYKDFIDEEVPLNPASPDWNPAWGDLYPMGVTGYINRSRVRIYGAEASAHWNMTHNWYTWGALAWARGKDQDTGRNLNSVAPFKASLAVGYRTDRWGAEALTTLASRRTQVEYPVPDVIPGSSPPASDFEAPGYGLLDLSAWWKPQAVKGLRLQAGVYNVFDKKYWNAISVPRPGRDVAPIDSYTEPGRSVRVSLTYQY